MSIKLDYTLNTPEERRDYVEKIIQENPDLSPQYLEYLADYLVFCMEKKQKKERQILTENRMATVNKRETSFEGLASQFENGEDGIYGLVREDKNIIFRHKIKIIEDIPEVIEVKKAIETWEAKLKKATGRDAYIIKKAIIELRKDQYLIQHCIQQPVQTPPSFHFANYTPLVNEEWVDENGFAHYTGVSLLNYKICSAILCNYSKLKMDSYSNFLSDTWYFMEDFDNISYQALAPRPLYLRLMELKIDGRQNQEIQQILQTEFGISYTIEYISSLWRNKIPRLIASQAEANLLDYWYLSVEKGKYKKCNRCGQIKLAHRRYFSSNSTSKDGFYSICKQCRTKKAVKKDGR